MTAARVLHGLDRMRAATTIAERHYTKSVPAGESYFVAFDAAIVVWSIPANKNIARFLLPDMEAPKVWELSRLWAPDGHERNLLTRAISAATRVLVKLERPDLVVSYADPNVGHLGGIYRAASWLYHGQSTETRRYERDGQAVARRAFHSGTRALKKADIERHGYREVKADGKHRFVRPLSRAARRLVKQEARP